MGRFRGVELADLELSGPRLRLRRWARDDADRVVDVMRDPSMTDFLALPDPYTREVALEFVTGFGHEGRDDGTGLGSAVVESATGRVVGSAALRLGRRPGDRLLDRPRRARARLRGRGDARLLAGFGFEHRAAPDPARLATSSNLASARTALAAGFRFEGVPRRGRQPGAQRRHRAARRRWPASPGWPPTPTPRSRPPSRRCRPAG